MNQYNNKRKVPFDTFLLFIYYIIYSTIPIGPEHLFDAFVNSEHALQLKYSIAFFFDVVLYTPFNRKQLNSIILSFINT